MKLNVDVQAFRAHRSGTLYGFATLFIPELQLKISDCPVHEKAGQRWLSFPAKPQLTKDGSVRRDDATGKILYASVIEFIDRDFRSAFSQRAIDSLLERFPHAFDEAAA